MTGGPRWQTAAAVALAIVTMAASFVFLSAEVAPSSALSRGIGLPASTESRAEALVANASPSLAARYEARRLTELSLSSDPANATSWLRLAYIDSLNPSGLGPAGLAALTTSYSLEPLGPDNSQWRLSFVFNHWGSLPPRLRARALMEFQATAKAGDFDKLPNDIVDPIGRLAAGVTLSPIIERLRLQERAKVARAKSATEAVLTGEQP